MVIYLYNKRIAISFLLIAISFYSYSQVNKKEFNSFDFYNDWGISINPVFLKKASSNPKFGNVNLNNTPMLSGQLGFKYRFFKNRKLNFNAGLKFNLLPLMNSNFKLSNEDVYESFNGFQEYIKEYGRIYLSIPVEAEYKVKINRRIIFNSSIGIDVFYLTRSRDEFSIQISSDELNETREIFATYQETQNNQLQVSSFFGAGMYFLFNKFMLQVNIIYNKNFQNLLEGEYQFGNLLVSEPARGDYKVSGDFIGLSTTIYFKKRKKK